MVPLSIITQLENENVAGFSGGYEIELSDSAQEETEAFFKCLAELGVNVIVSGKYFVSSVLHLLITTYRLMAIEIISESEMNHFCMMAEPVPIVTIARKEGHNSIFTLILHGSTNMILDKLVAIAGHAVQTYTILTEMMKKLKEHANAENNMFEKEIILKYSATLEKLPENKISFAKVVFIVVCPVTIHV
ncbi:hypothetical protein DY000_02043672 [Brassica cretica]|uniref:Uncharacterized protein n=1 Tax=Brassica cretica TaxID=69181 RepID=A0ABQ7BMX3_BRACR|nr:hypothetical protein DY000_02043672 [Brassica cretica]